MPWFEARLNRKLTEAEKIIGDMKKLAILQTKTMCHFMPRIGRYSGPVSDEKRYSLETETFAVLDSLGIPRDEVAREAQLLRERWIDDFKGLVRKLIANYVSENMEKSTDERKEALQTLQHRTDTNNPDESPESFPRAFRTILKEQENLPADDRDAILADIEEWLADAEYFIQHHEHRRPDLLFKTLDRR